MSRRERPRAKDERRRARAHAAPAPRARRRMPRGAFVTVIVLLIIAGAFAAFRLAPRPSPGARDLVADSLAAMDPRQALGRGVELGREGRHVESLPYFRRAAEAGAGWVGHWNYAAAMNNAAFEVWSRHGVAAPASRSAIERLALMRAALAEVQAAEQQAPDRRTLAMLELVRGRTLQLWGFPLDALEIFRAAVAIDSSSARARQMEADCLASLRGTPSSSAP